MDVLHLPRGMVSQGRLAFSVSATSGLSCLSRVFVLVVCALIWIR
jgi:hypothetical protein